MECLIKMITSISGGLPEPTAPIDPLYSFSNQINQKNPDESAPEIPRPFLLLNLYLSN